MVRKRARMSTVYMILGLAMMGCQAQLPDDSGLDGCVKTCTSLALVMCNGVIGEETREQCKRNAPKECVGLCGGAPSGNEEPEF